MTSPKLALERARRMIDRYVQTDDSLVDSLIADRRAEASVSKAILDASALLALLRREAGRKRLRWLFPMP